MATITFQNRLEKISNTPVTDFIVSYLSLLERGNLLHAYRSLGVETDASGRATLDIASTKLQRLFRIYILAKELARVLTTGYSRLQKSGYHREIFLVRKEGSTITISEVGFVTNSFHHPGELWIKRFGQCEEKRSQLFDSVLAHS